MGKGKARRFSVYFYEEQIEYLDKEAEKKNISRSKYIEQKTLPKYLQYLESKKGASKRGEK